MKTFGVFMLFFLIITITISALLNWSTQEVLIEGTILAYIMQQYFTEEN